MRRIRNEFALALDRGALPLQQPIDLLDSGMISLGRRPVCSSPLASGARRDTAAATSRTGCRSVRITSAITSARIGRRTATGSKRCERRTFSGVIARVHRLRNFHVTARVLNRVETIGSPAEVRLREAPAAHVGCPHERRGAHRLMPIRLPHGNFQTFVIIAITWHVHAARNHEARDLHELIVEKDLCFDFRLFVGKDRGGRAHENDDDPQRDDESAPQ